MEHFAGLDVSVNETSVCIVDDTRRTCLLLTQSGHRDRVRKLGWTGEMINNSVTPCLNRPLD